MKIKTKHNLTKTCHLACPEYYGSLNSEGECKSCADNCQTCREGYKNCTSCWGNEFLDRRTSTCMETCPAAISVATILKPTEVAKVAAMEKKHSSDISHYRSCEMCVDNCQYCNPGHTDVCTKCKGGLKLVESSRTCEAKCPMSTFPITMSLTGDDICL